MKTAYLLLLAAVAATTSLAAGASWSTTDEARAEAAHRNAAADLATSLRPLVPLDSDAVSVTDTDSARKAVALANARQTNEVHLAEMQRAGAGIKPAPIRVTDTDSARAAAAQTDREQALLAKYADYVKVQAKTKLEPSRVSSQ
jgi:hypothetical protein